MSDPFKWETTPIVNITQFDSAQDRMNLLDEMMSMHRTLRPPVDSLKQRLGKQKFTWVGEYRFWVWEGADWRVFASNKHGVSFEVRATLNREQAVAAWQDFKAKAGLK